MSGFRLYSFEFATIPMRICVVILSQCALRGMSMILTTEQLRARLHRWPSG